MKKLIVMLFLLLFLCSCTFVLIDKAEIGVVSEADIEKAEIKAVVDLKDKK